ncbi:MULTISPECIES: hypothetical protein [Pseudomonas]|uniref:Uncharacterized protein n=1 Tax=Pseudomonas juntendi TaxID=2666183 RepID=A0A7W2KKG3_9PSED|nr:MULTISPECIES: hypothetical protein [Pseudomonas]OAK61964.1 hypothetical protein A3K88_15175 [Pseudomonas putida]PPB16054.1 hypothetical protein HV87_15695 [Pseudomonas aeruginosa]EGB98202.1 hypothetical protein G1E_14487 [Pseudomonas sp. TJI-51]MBA6100126.1 hypothetical protein [Pseudomonas juntendi]MBA6141533.1 hypothetical protein [Pseudomonas juntendi]
MRFTPPSHTENARSEAEAFAEEMRKLRTSSPWTGVLLFYLGALSTALMLIAGIFILRSL